MAKRRLHELAKERELTAREVIQALESAGIEVKSALSTVEEATVVDALEKAGLNTKVTKAAKAPAKGAKAPAKPSAKPSATSSAAANGVPGIGQWIRLRRRRRQLRRLHESQLKELAGLAVELYRIDSPRGKDLAAERLKAAAETESELIALDRHFGPVEDAVECPKCGLNSKRTRYCLRCGEKLPTTRGPQNLSAPGAVVAVVAIAAAWLLGGVDLSGHSTPQKTALAPAVHKRQAPRLPKYESIVATVKGPRIGVYGNPTDQSPATRLSNPNLDGAPLVFLVKKVQGKWAHVYLPSRPNGSTGWIRLSKVSLAGHFFHLKINLTRHMLTAWKGPTRILHTPVGVGRAVTPTPPGLYFITELLKQPDPSGTYGPYAFGLSAHSNVLHEFAGRDGVLGLHGTNFPQGIGTNVSHGCIRMSNDAIIKLAHTLPLGTPVRIVGTV
jgi:lipoprotein-anchoring transpeptidase ErfK/SrfK/uncharacterized protein YjiS (DUF1127 family)